MSTLKLSDVSLDDNRVVFAEVKPAGWSGDLEVKKLQDALKKQEIPESVWPSLPSDNKCLERALHSMKGRRSLVRPLPKGRGWSVILENADDLDLERLDAGNAHKIELTCKVERGEYEHNVSTVRVTPEDHPAVPLIKDEFKRYRGEGDGEGLFKCSQDLSMWFSQTIVPWCRGVATRSRGGSYYVMRGKYLSRIRRVAKALEAASTTSERKLIVAGTEMTIPQVQVGGRLVVKPELATEAAVEVLIDNIINECDKTCDQLAEKLESNNLGVRALRTQKEVAENTMHKLKEFEELLGTNLDDVRDRLEEVKTGVGMAELQAQAEKDEKKQQKP